MSTHNMFLWTNKKNTITFQFKKSLYLSYDAIHFVQTMCMYSVTFEKTTTKNVLQCGYIRASQRVFSKRFTPDHV